MLLAVNFSPEAAELVTAGTVAVDLFKVPDWDELIEVATAIKPVEVHFPLQLGASQPGADLDRVADLMALTGTTRLNLHVAPSRERFPDVAVDDVSDGAKSTVTAGLLDDLAPYLERFGAGSVVLENLPYHGPERGLLQAGVEPGVLSDLVAASGVGLLLDLSHATISAAAFGVDVDDYLAGMPVGALADLHVSGVEELDGRLRDHLAMTDVDWALLERVLDRVSSGTWRRPRMLALEYGGVGPVFAWRTDGLVLEEQLPRLAAMVAACGPTPN